MCIYSLSTEDGAVNGYVLQALRAMRSSCEQIAVVVPEQQLSALQTVLDQVADLVIGSHKSNGNAYWLEGLHAYGANQLALYDEVLLLDEHVMGPVCDLNRMLERIEQEPADVWAMSGSKEQETIDWIWPHFLVVHGDVLVRLYKDISEQSCPNAEKRQKDLCKELIDAYGAKPHGIKLLWEESRKKTTLLETPVDLMPDEICPFFARDVFVHGFDELSRFSLAMQGERLMKHLQHCTSYDIGLIWEYLLRTCHMADICRNLGLYRVVPGNRRCAEPAVARDTVALAMHLYYEECFSSCFRYACSMPEDADVYLTTTTEEKKEMLQRLFSQRKWGHLEVRVIENRGRDVSSLLVGCRDLFDRYELICFAHDKKSHNGEIPTVGESFAEHCFVNVLGSSDYVENILALFRGEPRLGLLSPPPPFHANHAGLIGHEWTNNYPCAQKLAKQLGIVVPMSEQVAPVAPFGTLFWVRAKALKELVEYGWEYSDFPEEPNGVDGTMLHALERLYPFAVQQAGYYCALVAEENYARNYTLDLAHMLRRSRERYETDPLLHLFASRIKKKLKARLSEKNWDLLKKTLLRR